MRKQEGNKTTDRGSQRGEHRRNLKDTWGHGKSKHDTQDMEKQNIGHNKAWYKDMNQIQETKNQIQEQTQTGVMTTMFLVSSLRTPSACRGAHASTRCMLTLLGWRSKWRFQIWKLNELHQAFHQRGSKSIMTYFFFLKLSQRDASHLNISSARTNCKKQQQCHKSEHAVCMLDFYSLFSSSSMIAMSKSAQRHKTADLFSVDKCFNVSFNI